MEQKKREDIIHLTNEEIEAIYDSGKENTIALIKYLINEINNVKAEVQELKEKLTKDSHNSNKPPSSDGFNKSKKSKKDKKKNKRKPGGQKGHKGKTLDMVSNPDNTEIHKVDKCSDCGKSLKEIKPTGHQKRQVFDLPEEIKIIITEHQVEEKNCPYCGTHNQADFPSDVTHKTQYGKNLKTYAVYLSNYALIPYDRLAELFEDLFHIPLSSGTLFNINKKCSDLLEVTEGKIKNEIISSNVAYFDETGINIGGKLYWLHCSSTDFYTFYYPHANRGSIAMEKIGILSYFNGTAVHDHWKSYFNYDCLHALCNAHHLRELTFIYEEYKQKWAKKMINLLLEIKEKIGRTKRRKLSPGVILEFEKKYKRILNAGLRANPLPPKTNQKKRGRKKKSKTRNLLERLKYYQDSVLAFMYNFEVPFDNNQGERDLRMHKVKLKISCLYRSLEGAQIFCRIRGYISTVKKNSLNVFRAIKSILDYRDFLPVLLKTAE